jgi:hypothetical protein
MRPSAQDLPILELEPMDLLAFDILGPLSPVSIRFSKYIFVMVDYACRKTFLENYVNV